MTEIDKSSRVIPCRFSPKEIEKRLAFKCEKHSHNGMNHKKCYELENGVKERKGFLDIETTNLKANFGIMLTWYIRDVDTGDMFYDYITNEDMESNISDKRINETLINTMWKFDRLIGHFAVYFDFPFVRTRAIHWNLEFPTYGNFFYTDTWKMAKKLLCLHSNRQNCVADAVQHRSYKTRINPNVWNAVLHGSSKTKKESIKEVLTHNEFDVIEGVGNYLALLPYYNETKSYL
jgi:uncharacterized protein YprB with RNaseH-like and TPR domain